MGLSLRVEIHEIQEINLKFSSEGDVPVARMNWNFSIGKMQIYLTSFCKKIFLTLQSSLEEYFI